MQAGTLLLILRDIITLCEQQGLILPDGAFVGPKTPEQDVALAAGVEAALKAHGVPVPAKVDQVIQLIPLVAALVK